MDVLWNKLAAAVVMIALIAFVRLAFGERGLELFFRGARRLTFFSLILVFGVAVLYFGGWAFVDGETYNRGLYAMENRPFVLGESRIAIRIGSVPGIEAPIGVYYGLAITDRFFDSPVISWISGIVGVSVIWGGLGVLFGRSRESESND